MKDVVDGKISTIFTEKHDKPLKSMKEVEKFKHISLVI